MNTFNGVANDECEEYMEWICLHKTCKYAACNEFSMLLALQTGNNSCLRTKARLVEQRTRVHAKAYKRISKEIKCQRLVIIKPTESSSDTSRFVWLYDVKSHRYRLSFKQCTCPKGTLIAIKGGICWVRYVQILSSNYKLIAYH